MSSSGSDNTPEPINQPPKGKRKGGRWYNGDVVFKASWLQVAQALWMRYPNPCSSHVLTEDTIFREQSSPSKLSSKRLIRKTNRAPRWMELFVAKDRCAAVMEESVVDLNQRTFTTMTRNLTYSTLMAVEEKCVYFESPENNEWTCCRKEAWIKCGVHGVGRPAEKFGLERYKRNSKKAEQGLEHVLCKLFSIPLVTLPSKHTSVPITRSNQI